jgi:hypothetical protein
MSMAYTRAPNPQRYTLMVPETCHHYIAAHIVSVEVFISADDQIFRQFVFAPCSVNSSSKQSVEKIMAVLCRIVNLSG